MAIQRAIPTLGLLRQPDSVDELLALVLGERQFGPNHWQLSLGRRLYYKVKPLVPRVLPRLLRRIHSPLIKARSLLVWPIEDRYARFQWEVMRQILMVTGQHEIHFRNFWPDGQQLAFVITHDVETGKGQANIKAIIELEESFGLRSSFNFVPGDYIIDSSLLQELRDRGFEIGIHGYKHDGRLFNSHDEFIQQALWINKYLKEFEAVGFRSPLTMRNPEWMQSLEIEYDSSFFDTDPFEPMPGGTMSIWPFTVGRFVEMPYTLVQDATLTYVLGEKTSRLWVEKVDFLERYQGMALVNTHPDYLSDQSNWLIYKDFLQTMSDRERYWQALPREVARWWLYRNGEDLSGSLFNVSMGCVRIYNGELLIN